MKDVSERSLTLSYVIALMIIAGLLVTCHVVIEGELQISKRSSALINISGRQRMLSQRIAGMAAEYRLGVPGAREQLVDATNSFEAAREQLVSETSASTSRDPYELQLKSLYFTSSAPLDRPLATPLAIQTRDYIARARAIAALPANDPRQPARLLALFAEAKSPLLDSLEQAVALRQQAAESRITDLQHLQSVILAVALMTLIVEGLAIFRPMVSRIVAYNEELVVLASTDQLTNIANRRSFILYGASEIARAKRYDRRAALLAVDVDHFKLVNDRHGHAAGDEVLIAVSSRLRQGLRALDLFGRVGGEEFAILLPETGLDDALQVAERLRNAVANLQVRYDGKLLKVTISIGVVELSPAMANLSDVMSAADAALYRAKAEGRNCVVKAAA